MAFGQVIRDLREQQGLTQYELADRSEAELSQNFISQVETGRIDRPTIPKVRALAKALGASFPWLMSQAGYYEWEEVATNPRGELDRIKADVWQAAENDPRLLSSLLEIREANDEETYHLALRIIHRSLKTGIETAREVIGGAKRPPAAKQR
ncbi:MAG: helix-turn-helix domain-containing protein [Thermomicrobiales bacterium]